MVDKNTFLETLHLVQEIAKTSPEPMDRETVMAYFDDMELTEQQEELIYEYFRTPQEEQETERAEENPQTEENQEDFSENTDGELSAEEEESAAGHFQMYLDELKDFSGKEETLGVWLQRVISIAKEYTGRGVLLEDLVQEGNIGLLTAMDHLGEDTSEEKDAYVEEAVRAAIQDYLEFEGGEKEQNDSVLGKVSLVHKAMEFLKEERGEKPTLEELAEYTRISKEEIGDILSLLKQD